MGLLKGRWPRAVFYDSKGTLFDWPWTWKTAAEKIVKKYSAAVTAQQSSETWATVFERQHRRAAAVRYTRESELIQQALLTTVNVHDIEGSPQDVNLMLELQNQVQLFLETEAALQEQQDLGVKVLIY